MTALEKGTPSQVGYVVALRELAAEIDPAGRRVSKRPVKRHAKRCHDKAVRA